MHTKKKKKKKKKKEIKKRLEEELEEINCSVLMFNDALSEGNPSVLRKNFQPAGHANVILYHVKLCAIITEITLLIKELRCENVVLR